MWQTAPPSWREGGPPRLTIPPGPLTSFRGGIIILRLLLLFLLFNPSVHAQSIEQAKFKITGKSLRACIGFIKLKNLVLYSFVHLLINNFPFVNINIFFIYLFVHLFIHLFIL